MTTAEQHDSFRDVPHVAHTILQQLGGRRFRMMTGARNFVGAQHADGLGFLRFRLPNPRCFIQVTLAANDTYTVIRLKMNGQVKSECETVYAENLRAVFTGMTGLQTSL